MKKFSLAAAALVLAALPVFAKPGDPEIRWSRTWEEAVKEAKERNVPIHVSFHKDNCPRCTGMDSSVYNNKDFIAASRHWVNVYCNKDTSHGTVKVNGVEMCKLIPSIKCEDHVACDRGAGSMAYFTGTMGTPATVWADATGKKIDSNQGGMAAKALIEKFVEVEKTVGPGLGADEYAVLQDKLAAGAKATTDGKIHDAIDAYVAVTKMSKVPGAKTWTEQAQAALDKLAEEGKKRLMDAVAMKDAKDFEKARASLKQLSADFKGQPLAKEIDKATAETAAAEKEAKGK